MSGFENSSSVPRVSPVDPRTLEGFAKETVENPFKDRALGSLADERIILSIRREIAEKRGRFLAHNLRLQLR
ncbi:MAG: hypothetical protein ACE5IB_05365 [Candidatus Geothermarchaeales archaeon]